MLAKKSTSFIDQQAGKQPFFLYVAPYVPPMYIPPPVQVYTPPVVNVTPLPVVFVPLLPPPTVFSPVLEQPAPDLTPSAGAITTINIDSGPTISINDAPPANAPTLANIIFAQQQADAGPAAPIVAPLEQYMAGPMTPPAVAPIVDHVAGPTVVVPPANPIPIARVETSPVTVPANPPLDLQFWPAQPATMSSPSGSLSMPASVFPGQAFTVLARVSDPDGDLRYVSIRQQGYGIVGGGEISGSEFNTAAYLTAPAASGPQLFRLEVVDAAGGGYTGDWQTLNVLPQPAPNITNLGQWVQIIDTPTSSGAHQATIRVMPGAPAYVQQAVTQADIMQRDLGDVGPQQLYDRLQTLLLQYAAQSTAIGVSAPDLTVNPNLAAGTKTIVAYEGPNPVIQEVTGNGAVRQYTDTPSGQTNIKTVVELGTYVPPYVPPAVNVVTNPPPTAAAGANSSQVVINQPICGIGNPGPEFDPIHRLQGYNAAGRAVYRLTDECGKVIEWELDETGTAVNFRNLGPKATAPVFVGRQASPSTTIAANTKPALLLWGAAAALAFLAFRD